MVTTDILLMNRAVLNQANVFLTDHEIVETPPFILCSGLSPLREERELLLVRIQMSESVNEARIKELGEGLPFLWSETSYLFLPLWIKDINLVVSHV